MSQAPITRAIWPDLPPMPATRAVAHSKRTYSVADFAKIKAGCTPNGFPERMLFPKELMFVEDLVLYVYEFVPAQTDFTEPKPALLALKDFQSIDSHHAVCVYMVHFDNEHDPTIAGVQDIYSIREIWINAASDQMSATIGRPYYTSSRCLYLVDTRLLKNRGMITKREYFSPSPPADERIQLRIRKTYTPDEYHQICLGIAAKDMDDKWNAYVEDDWLYIHRSWTRFCIFEVQFALTHEGYAIAEAWVNRGKQYRSQDAGYDAQFCLSAINMVLWNHGWGDWPHEPYPLTEQRAPLAFERTLSAEEYALTRQPYVDWKRHLHICHYDWLYVQTDPGAPAIFQVRFERAGDGYRAAEAWVSHNPQDHPITDPARNARILHEVIDRFLLKRPPGRR
ncbi:MAG TPA: hypothetical protein VD886_11555 [Herpetosiphonaceae bacterium]|nr:hypothetical protein [Herpetosiphonaceae bacterium]